MQHTRMVELVRREGGLSSWNVAERATRATLGVLGARLNASRGLDVALRLPAALATEVDEQADAEEFDVAELYDRIAAATGQTSADARKHARVVVSALRQESTVDLDEVLAGLPPDYADLLGTSTMRSARTGRS